MVNIYIEFYVITKYRVLLFCRESRLVSVPFIGASISFEDGSYQVESVEFRNNSDHVDAIVMDGNNGTPQDDIDDDSKVEEIIMDYKDCGWNLASNVKRNQFSGKKLKLSGEMNYS